MQRDWFKNKLSKLTSEEPVEPLVTVVVGENESKREWRIF